MGKPLSKIETKVNSGARPKKAIVINGPMTNRLRDMEKEYSFL